MKHKQLALTLGALIIGILVLLFSCRKINEATTLGGGLIPVVDNIYTFDTTLEVEAFNDTFSIATDSAVFYGNSYPHFLGQINNDPFFGKTDAKLFLELKPPLYKYTFSDVSDSLHLDSVVLILEHEQIYGDTVTQQTVNVYEIPQSSNFGDTILPIRKSNYAKGALLGSRTFSPMILNDSVKAYQDTTVNQLRIRLDDAFGQRLLNYDTISSGNNAAYISDSAFRSHFKGFALESVSGNALMGFDLLGANTKLAIYYKDDHNDSPVEKWDTIVAYFTFASFGTSASANYIERDYTGTPVAAAVGGTDQDDIIYIQNAPGTFATIKIPELPNLNNRIVHSAELIMEQVYDVSDTLFPPARLYLDAYDSSVSKFRAIPYDFSIDNTGATNLSSFGVNPINTKDSAGHNIKSWRFNITRYVQHVVNDTEPAYELRLSAPFYYDELYRPGPAGSTSTVARIFVNNAIANGRVRLGGGNHPQRMRVRIVYSKI